MTDYTTTTGPSSSSDPEQIRQEIEETRASLGNDVDALADKVRPSSIVNRQAGKVRSAIGGVRERVMGVASDAKENASGMGHAMADAPQKVVRQAEGHPIAVGLIAFGVGLLASSLIPSTAKERELVDTAKEAAEPVKEQLTDAAKQVADNLREPAKEAVESVKGSAQDAVSAVKDDASSAASDVKESAQQGSSQQGTNQQGTAQQGSML